MSSHPPNPLRLLARLKWRGKLRLLMRRSRTLGGAISLLVGVLLLAAWVASVVLRSSLVERTVDPPSVELVRLGLVAYLGFIGFSSLSFRGVYMPRPELERLFAAPVRRRSIIRFRMFGAMLMALPFTLIVALFLSPRFASPWAAAFGLGLTIPATSIFGQSLSLVAARTGGVVDYVLRRIPPTALRIVGAVGILGIFTFLAFGPGIESRPQPAQVRYADSQAGPGHRATLGAESEKKGTASDALARADQLAKSRLVRTATLPLAPWARAIAAPSVPAALPWLGLIAALVVVLFEAVARIPIDFRETSLRTSRDLESKMARIRGGQGGAGVFGTSKHTRGWSVPWLAGHSPFGAVFWVRTTWLVRQARGTLVIVGAVAVIGVVLGIRVFDERGSGPATLAILGVVYLASGVRADFRTDLDRMEQLRAWPLAPWKLFVATLLPGVLLTTTVISTMLLVRGVALRQLGLDLWLTLACIPFLSYVWTAVDNAVFLLFPVRFVPGQGSALQHTGRGFLLVMLRGLMLVGALAVALGGAYFLYEYVVGGSYERHRLGLGLACLWLALTAMLMLAVLTTFGAWALSRFDVSKSPAKGS